jgi:hypothetical protein
MIILRLILFNIFKDQQFLNLPINLDKETPMQIEDKVVLSNVYDAVSVAALKLNYASAVLFQSACVNLIENLYSFKNVIFLIFY